MNSRSPLSPPPKDGLDTLLGEWRVETKVAPNFQGEVWRRIAHAEDALSASERLLLWWLSPARLALSAALVIFGGFSSGVVTSHLHNVQAKHAYFRSIDPLDRQHTHSSLSMTKPVEHKP